MLNGTGINRLAAFTHAEVDKSFVARALNRSTAKRPSLRKSRQYTINFVAWLSMWIVVSCRTDQMFSRSAEFYDAIYNFKDYAASVEKLRLLIQQACPHATSLLDVACGTGKHLYYLRNYYSVEGLDLNAELLQTARQRCPGITFHQADMVDFHLGRSFDVVTCLFSSIGYVKTLENLGKAISSMAHHLKVDGLLVVEPWFTPENYWKHRVTLNHVEQPELKIAWMYVSEAEGPVAITDIHYLVGTPKGVDHFVERHELGLFTHEQYLEALRNCNLEVQYDPIGLFSRGMYLGFKRATAEQAS
jgi:SAM-dependent methyltransferase